MLLFHHTLSQNCTRKLSKAQNGGMKDKIEALNMNETWCITDLAPGKRPIGCK